MNFQEFPAICFMDFHEFTYKNIYTLISMIHTAISMNHIAFLKIIIIVILMALKN